MFKLEGSGYFCCTPGSIGVNDMAKTGGLCEPDNQVVPQTLLATLINQATATAAAPSAITNATATSGAPLETNPMLAPTSTADGASSSQAPDPGFQLKTPSIAGISVGGIVVVILVIVCLVRRRSHVTTVYPRYNHCYSPSTRSPEGLYSRVYRTNYDSGSIPSGGDA